MHPRALLIDDNGRVQLPTRSFCGAYLHVSKSACDHPRQVACRACLAERTLHCTSKGERAGKVYAQLVLSAMHVAALPYQTLEHSSAPIGGTSAAGSAQLPSSEGLQACLPMCHLSDAEVIRHHPICSVPHHICIPGYTTYP